MSDHVVLPPDSNQALGIARFAIDFMSDEPGKRGEPGSAVLERTNQFHTDAVLCGVSALALGTNAPVLLRNEALRYRVAADAGLPWARVPAAMPGATVFGSGLPLSPEKAVVANCAAVREWDSNGTNFGFRPERGHTAGEFGHNDFYSVPLAAAQLRAKDGEFALRGMILLDEVRGRLAEVFSLKSYKIDHVLHGAIASAATFGAMMGATAEEIESAIGMVVAHYVPFRAIRAGKQLSDSKGASAAISTEAAVLSVMRSMSGFLGPRDIFRNPEAVFRLFEGPGQMFQKVGAAKANTEKRDASPFELVLTRAGDDFAVMGMHFKIGLYEHQSAGAVQAVIDLCAANPGLLESAGGENIRAIKIVAYEPALGIIGDPAKRDPKTRQSADHSMVYIIATLLRKALEKKKADWFSLMLGPYDYHRDAIFHPVSRALMEKISFEHGGPEYDRRYPDGIPTSVVITDAAGRTLDSGLVMYPAGHARNTTADLRALLKAKWELLGALAANDPAALVARLSRLESRPAAEVARLYDFPILDRGKFE